MSDRRIALLLSGVLLFSYGYFFPRWAEWNQNSRMDLTLALVEQGTIRIDDYYENTGDYAVYDGHIYTDKAPGTSFLGVPAYYAFRLIAGRPAAAALLERLASSQALESTLREGGSGLLPEKIYFAAALYATTFVTVSVPSALIGGLLYLFLGRILPGQMPRAALTLAYGLGTIVFPYSTVFYGHQIAAALLFFTFLLFFRIRRRELDPRWLWGGGALLGLAVLVDFPSVIPAGILSLYALFSLERRWEILRVVAAGLPFAFVLGWYNNAAFGSPFASSYRYLGMFPEISNTGILGFSRPSLEALWGVTFSPYRGLFFLSPFLLLALPGARDLLRRGEMRTEVVLWGVLALSQLGLVSAWYDWRGGFALGPRNLLVILPFLIPLVAACVRAWKSRPALSILAWGLIAVSSAVVFVASVSGQEFAPIVIANPLVEFFWPKFVAGDITRNLGMAVGLSAWLSLLPVILVLGVLLWLVQMNGRPSERRS